MLAIYSTRASFIVLQVVTTIPTARLPESCTIGRKKPKPEMAEEDESIEDDPDEIGRRGQILWIRGLTRLQHQVGSSFSYHSRSSRCSSLTQTLSRLTTLTFIWVASMVTHRACAHEHTYAHPCLGSFSCLQESPVVVSVRVLTFVVHTADPFAISWLWQHAVHSLCLHLVTSLHSTRHPLFRNF